MSITKTVGLGLIAAVLAVTVPSVFAESPAAAPAATVKIKAPETVTVVGTVAATKDSKGNVETVTITADDGAVYQVLQNVEGKTIAKEDGKKIEAKGTVFERSGKKMFHVKTFTAAK